MLDAGKKKRFYHVAGAFTLVELLVVISIIASLLAVLMPALHKAKQQAHNLVCQTRLKDFGNAIGIYLCEYSDTLPANRATAGESYPASDARTYWYGRLARYYHKKISSSQILEAVHYNQFRCPTLDWYSEWSMDNIRRGAARGSYQPCNKGGSLPVGSAIGIYGFNPYFAGDNFPRYRKSSSIMQPGSLPLLGDMNIIYENYPIGGGIMWDVSYPNYNAIKYKWPAGKTGSDAANYCKSYGPGVNHNGGISYLFADMHCEIKKDMWPWNNKADLSVRKDYFHPKRNYRLDQ